VQHVTPVTSPNPQDSAIHPSADPPDLAQPSGPAEYSDAASYSGPEPWPGTAVSDAVASASAAPDQQTDGGDVPFWDWAPSGDAEDMRFSLDDPPDEEPGDGEVIVSQVIIGGQQAAAKSGAGPTGSGGRPVVTPVEAEDVPARKEGIGHRLGSLDHVFGDTRMGAWRRRAVVAIIAGVIVTILLNWRYGLTVAVVVAIADTIYRSRKIPPPQPGLRMSRAQKMTQRQLIKLERSGYRALHSRLIPDSEDHIDHLVVGPAGVFAIDSESWEKKLPIRTKNARQLWLGPFSKKERLEHARWESERAAEYITAHADRQLLDTLPGGSVRVRPAMAVYGPKIPWDIATIREVDVFSGARLRNYLRRYARQNNTKPLNAAQIGQIYQAAHNAFPESSGG
jgi:hypothetical protein